MQRTEEPQSADRLPSLHRQLIARLRGEIERALDPLIAREGRIALLDFPNFRNVGDSAIWLGTIAYLRSRGIERPCYTADQSTYSRAHLAARIGHGTILLSGGGNLGDLWPHHQRFREEVIAGHPDSRIIQLPQSIWFERPRALVRAREVFDRHPDLTLLVRDRKSLMIARREFRARSELCPDMALYLDPLCRSSSASQGAFFLSRTDHESPPDATRDCAVGRADWLVERQSWLVVVNRVSRRLPFRSRALRCLRGPLSRTYEPLARQRVERGRSMLTAARVVITNRLHGHILCLLLEIPHVLLDNRYGKIRSFYETWTHDSELTRWCDSEGEALARAQEMARALAGGGPV